MAGYRKHIDVSELGKTAERVSVDTRWTVEEFLRERGIDWNEVTVEGVRGNSSRELDLDDKINGYKELVIIPNVKGGNQ